MRVFVVLALFLATTIAFAADQETEKKPKATAVKKSVRQEPVPEKTAPTWPRPYKPSEEISADSSVPFPTDI